MVSIVRFKIQNWYIELREVNPVGLVLVCSNCGIKIKNLDIKSVETGCFYCSEYCAAEDTRATVKNTIQEISG